DSLSLCTTSASEAKRCCLHSLSCWSRKTLESNKSAVRFPALIDPRFVRRVKRCEMHCAQLPTATLPTAQLPTAQRISPLRAHLPETSRPGKLVYLGQAQRQQAACKALDFGIGRHQIRLAQPALAAGQLEHHQR